MDSRRGNRLLLQDPGRASILFMRPGVARHKESSMSLPKGLSSVRILCLFALVPALLSGSRVDAGVLMLSADSSSIEGLVGSSTIPFNPGNVTFYNNVLGGGKNVQILSTTLNNTIGTPSQLSVLNTFYNSQPGVTSSIVTGPITTALLANTNLFIDDLPDAPLTASANLQRP